MDTKTRTEQILVIMRVLAWIAFIGLTIKVGAILTSYAVSCVNPTAAKDLYRGLDFYKLSQHNFWYYSQFVSFLVAYTGLKAYMIFLVIRSLSKVNLANPFTNEVARILERISYTLLAIWIIAQLNNTHASWLLKKTDMTLGDLATGEFLFMAGLVFIISQVFKRGVEIQSENELTV